MHQASSVIPPVAKDDIINFSAKGQACLEQFIKDRLLKNSPKSVWGHNPRLNLKTFSNHMPKTKLKIGETVIKLREERNLYGRFLSLMEYRPGVSGTAWLRTTVAFPAWSWLYIRTELPQPGPRWSTL